MQMLFQYAKVILFNVNGRTKDLTLSLELLLLELCERDATMRYVALSHFHNLNDTTLGGCGRLSDVSIAL